ncbi:MAG: replicative DNA helicase [Bacillota bacterium]|nr:replicative DNA helicase [Bacillota bacterium]
MKPVTERIPPHSEEAEKAVLGASMIDKNALMDASDILRPDDFYKEAHKEIFSVLIELYKENEPVDMLTAAEALKKRKSLEAVGGRAYLAMLTAAVVSTANIEQYARIIEEKAILRSLIRASSETVEDGYSAEKTAGEILETAEQRVFSISQKRQRKGVSHIGEVLVKNINTIQMLTEKKGELRGLTTGFTALDDVTSGLQKADLIILAARPSMGKTAFALNIATNAAKAGGKVLIFSLEMSEELLSERILSTEALVEIKRMREGTIDDEEWTKITDAAVRLDKLDIMIDDTPGISALEIKNKCKRMKMEKGLDLVVVDYLQLMTFEGRAESRQLEISALTRYLKQLAREIDCPVIVLSQLSRAVESRKGDEKKPVLSDLRESGSIEQDADIVMFLYREDYYKKEESTRPNECDVIIAKHRNGPTDTVVLTWVGKYTKFSDMVQKNLNI